MTSSIVTFQVCIVLCGLPASGKSTLASQINQALLGMNPLHLAERIDIDVLRTDFYQGAGIDAMFSPEHEASVREAKVAEIVAALGQGKSIIDDDMNYFRSMRKEIAEACCKARVHYAIIQVTTPLKKCLEWNRKRGQPIPDEVVETVAQRLDAPGSRSYAWDAPFYMANLAKTPAARASSEFMDRLARATFMLQTNVNLMNLLDGASSVLDNPAFWNLAKIDAIVNDGYLINDVQEWKDRIDSKTADAVTTFDVATRRAVNARVKQNVTMSRQALRDITSFKKRAIKLLREDQSRLKALLDEFNIMLDSSTTG